MKTKPARADSNLNGLLETIGQQLLELRIKAGYTSHADFASDHGLPRIQYWRMEKGRANITLKSLAKVLQIHGLTLEVFLGSVVKQVTRENARIK